MEPMEYYETENKSDIVVKEEETEYWQHPTPEFVIQEDETEETSTVLIKQECSSESSCNEETDPLCLDEQEDIQDMVIKQEEFQHWQPPAPDSVIKQERNVQVEESTEVLSGNGSPTSSDVTHTPPDDFHVQNASRSERDKWHSTSSDDILKYLLDHGSKETTGTNHVSGERSPVNGAQSCSPAFTPLHCMENTNMRHLQSSECLPTVAEKQSKHHTEETRAKGSQMNRTMSKVLFSKLIVDAIMQSPKRQLTAFQIFSYLKHNRLLPSGNTQKRKRCISDTLCHKEYFVKAGRVEGSPGFYWTVDPLFARNLKKGFKAAFLSWKKSTAGHRKQSTGRGRRERSAQPDCKRRKCKATSEEVAVPSHENPRVEQTAEPSRAEVTVKTTAAISEPCLTELAVNAIMRSGKRRLTLLQICSNIKSKCPSLSNNVYDSIRLLLHRKTYFVRNASFGLTGCHWTLDPVFVKMLDKGFLSADQRWKQRTSGQKKQLAQHGQQECTTQPRTESPPSNDVPARSLVEDTTAGAAEVAGTNTPPSPIKCIVNAILQSPGRRLTFSEIVQYLESNCPWPSGNGVNWRIYTVDVLSKHNYFVKKGHNGVSSEYYWTLDPTFAEYMEAGFDSATCSWRELTAGHREQSAEHSHQSSVSTTPGDAAVPSHSECRTEDPTKSCSSDTVSAAEDTASDSQTSYSGPAPSLRQLVIQAIMQSPDRRATTDQIHTYCKSHLRPGELFQVGKFVQMLCTEPCFVEVTQTAGKGRTRYYWTVDMQLVADSSSRLGHHAEPTSTADHEQPEGSTAPHSRTENPRVTGNSSASGDSGFLQPDFEFLSSCHEEYDPLATDEATSFEFVSCSLEDSDPLAIGEEEDAKYLDAHLRREGHIEYCPSGT